MKQAFFFIITLIVVILNGCSPKYYSANIQNTPLISSKGETNLTLAGNTNQVEFQGAYGVTNGFAVVASGSFFKITDSYLGDGGSGNFFELGGGFFNPLVNNLVFETYGIVGFGSVEKHFPSSVQANPQTNGNISANILRIGIQPNIGYKSKEFSAAISSRVVNLTYSNVKGDLIHEGENQVNYLNSNKSNFLIEPAITVKGGLERIKLQLQFGRSFNLSQRNFKQDKIFVTLGLNYNFK